METCVRGFSYMPESKLDTNLQYIEDSELERAWKVNRRQRLKDQEQRIWEEFVKEQDIVRKAYSEDPYQFLHELPENCLKELMDAELNKMKKDTEQEVVVEVSDIGEGDHPEKQAVHMVTFAEDNEPPDLDMFHIFDDENDANQSGEDEQLESPSTVRERCSDDAAPPAPADDDAHKADGQIVTVAVKATENVTNVIESSIYCARVKDIRLKIGEEMHAVIASLDVQDVMSVERAEVSRRCRRAAEFCARFHRIYMYQLQRQVHNIKRHVSAALPLAQHTQFQSQMLRVVSLHQNMLQALQVFHKSFPATSCLRSCARALCALCALVRDASALCAALPAPRDFAAARDLYDDELLQSCDAVDKAVGEYSLRVADFLSSSNIPAVDLSTAPSSTRTKRSKKGCLTYTKTESKSGSKAGTKTWSTKDTDARLSMYSLDTLRANARSSASRENQSSGTSKGRASPRAGGAPRPPPARSPDKTGKRIIRRPLMRAPRSAAPRLRAARRDLDVPTMVEAVDTSESSHAVSQPLSPTSRERTPRHNTPRPPSPPHDPRASQRSSPRLKQVTVSPRVKSRRASPKPLPVKKSPTTIRSETPTTVTTVKTQIAPVTKIQCARKQPRPTDKSCDRSGKSPDRPAKSPERPTNKGKSPDRSGKSTDRSRKLEKSPDGTAKSANKARNEKNIGRGKENDKINDHSARGKADKYSNRNKVDKNIVKVDKNNVRVDNEDNIDTDGSGKIEIDGSLDTDGSMGTIFRDVIYAKVEAPGHIGNPGKEDNTGREFCGVKELTDAGEDYSRCYAREVDEERSERERTRPSRHMSPARCDLTRLLRQLCSGDPAGICNERVTGAKNAQLLCVRGGSPSRQPSTPQLLRILEETIQKQSPRPIFVKPRNPERYRLNFNIPETTASRLFQYRTKFVQHMLTSPLYANSAVGKPWEMIGNVSDKIIDELLTSIAKEMEIKPVLRDLYKCETN